MIINNLKNETGSSLLFIIISIVVLGVLGAGMVSLFTSSTVSVFTPNYSLKARYMAEAGIRYAKGKIKDEIINGTDKETAFNDLTGNGGGKDYMLEDGNSFTLNRIPETYEIISTGVSGTGIAASYIKLSHTFTFEEDSGSWEKDAKNVLSGENDMSINGGASVEGSISTKKDFSIAEGGKLKGDVNAGEDVTVAGGGKVDGNIVSGGDVSVSATVTGNIDAQGDVFIKDGGVVNGNITTTEDVVIKGIVYGTINAGGTVTIEDGGVVNGNITTTGDVVIKGTVYGTINAGGSVTIKGGSNVYGDIIAGGDVNLTNGKAHGNVDSGGDITLTWSGFIGGNATAAGEVIFPAGARSQISGSIFENTASPPRLVPEDPEDPEEYYESTLQLPDILFTAGETDIYGSNTVTKTPLAPGDYGVLRTKWDGTDICLKPGKYYFKEISATFSASALYLDLSEATEKNGIEIFVVGDAVFGSNFKVMVSTDGINYQESTAADKSLAAHLYLETRTKFEMMSSGHWFGAVYSWGELSISSGGSRYIGSFYLRDLNKLTVPSDVNIILVPSNYIKNYWEHDGE